MTWPAKLAPWLRGIFFTDEHGKAKDLSRLELRRVGTVDSAIETWVYDEDTRIEENDVDEFAGSITTLAHGDAEESIEHISKYVVLAFYGNFGFASSTSPPVLIESTRRMAEIGQEEGPTSKGLVTQLMRHTEALTKLVVANTAQNQAHSERMLEKAYGRIELLEQRAIDAVELAERVADQSHEREIAGKREIAKIARQQEAWEGAKVLLPTVVNKIVGKHLLPQKTTPKEEIIHTLLASLRPTQLEKIMEVLDPPQLAGFAEVYNEERELEEKRKAEAEAKDKAMANGGGHAN